MFESKSNYVNMSIFMTVDPGRQEKEFLWIRAKADTGKNVTVVCGTNIPSDVSLNCPTSTSTTPTTTTTVVTTTAAAGTTATAVASATSTSSTTKQATMEPNTVSTQKPGGVKPSAETSSPKGTDISTSTREPQPSTPSKEVFIIGGSVGGAVLIAVIVTITVCVRRRKRNSSENTDQKREIMNESQENGYSSNGARNSGGDNGCMSNPIYEATDDYKMEQLHRNSCGDEGSGHETVSPYALSGPARPGLSLKKNTWVTQSKLDYFDDILFNDQPSGEDSEETSDVQASDLYAKVNKPQRTDQVSDIYAKVDKSRTTVRGTSGSCADGSENDDVATLYAKVQK
ncbi:myb-like protein X [Haliotis rubra]|uniref:myb-like protein X n=1 Tax=Haliotis rubra TaxID=36100 RepID=UPI001EE4FAA7|nr:myb-like protein X [Haliotis rubra]